MQESYSEGLAIHTGPESCGCVGIRTTIDLQKMFTRLVSRQRNEKDDSRVIGHVKADEVETVEKMEHRKNKDDETKE